MTPSFYAYTEADWLAARYGWVGASEIHDLIYEPWALWAKKFYRLHGEDNLFFAEARAMEPYIARRYTDREGIALYDPGDFAVCQHPDFQHLAATPDRVGKNRYDQINWLVELKYVRYKIEDWEDLPARVWAQVQAQMACVGVHRADVAALIADCKQGRLKVWNVVYDAEFIANLGPMIEAWWARHVDGGVPPEPGDGAKLAEAWKRIPHVTKEPPRWAEGDEAAQLIAADTERLTAMGIIKAATADKVRAEAMIKVMMGEGGVQAMGETWAYVPQKNRSSFSLRRKEM